MQEKSSAERTTPGRLGATRQSWRIASPRSLLESLVYRLPHLDKSELLQKFEDEVRQREDLISTIIEYWFTNNYNSLIRQQTPDPVRTAQIAQVREKAAREVREAVTKTIDQRARVMMLDLMMPNGKRLWACTGDECLTLSKIAGRWLAAIAKEVPAKSRVGEVLSEDRLHELYGMAA